MTRNGDRAAQPGLQRVARDGGQGVGRMNEKRLVLAAVPGGYPTHPTHLGWFIFDVDCLRDKRLWFVSHGKCDMALLGED
jgi:hypothetical protein